MEKKTGMKSGTLQKEANSCRKNKPSNGNRREKVEDWDEKTLTTDNKSQQWDLLKNSKKESESQRDRTIEWT